MESPPQVLRLSGSRTSAAFRALFFGLVFALPATALLHMGKDVGTKIPIIGLIWLLIGCSGAGIMAFFSAFKSIHPEWIEITSQRLTINSYGPIRTYSWSELGAPKVVTLSRGNRFINFDNAKTMLLPEKFRCREGQLLDIINAARDGRIIEPAQWRKEHPFQLWKSILIGLATFLTVLILKFGPTLLR